MLFIHDNIKIQLFPFYVIQEQQWIVCERKCLRGIKNVANLQVGERETMRGFFRVRVLLDSYWNWHRLGFENFMTVKKIIISGGCFGEVSNTKCVSWIY
jgi:hypothetical protein